MSSHSDAGKQPTRKYSQSELGTLAHLYRGEIYRSTIWRTRLDTTTNWAVVTLGVALSISFASPNSSPIPLVLVGLLIMFFVVLEARRYRYFNVWRARARWMERHIVAPILRDGDLHTERGWQDTLAEDYLHPAYHIGFWTAIGRRIRRNYLWLLILQTLAFGGKLMVHPTMATTMDDFWRRAAIGPISGKVVVAAGIIYILSWAAIAIVTMRIDRARHLGRHSADAMG